MQTIILVSCVSKKRTEPALARDLYISPWFRKARAYAEHHGDAWYILSAKHHLITPVTWIAPYNTTLNTMPALERQDWSARVVQMLRDILLPQYDRLVILAGQRYRQYVVPRLELAGFEVEVPMAGLSIGQQLQWLGNEASNSTMKAYRCIWSGMPDIVAYYAGQTASSARYNAYRVLDDIRRDVQITEISVTRAPEYDHLAQNKPSEHWEYHISAAERGVDE